MSFSLSGTAKKRDHWKQFWLILGLAKLAATISAAAAQQSVPGPAPSTLQKPANCENHARLLHQNTNLIGSLLMLAQCYRCHITRRHIQRHYPPTLLLASSLYSHDGLFRRD